MITILAFKFRVPGLNGTGGILRLHWSKRRALATKFDWLVKSQTTYKHPGPVRFELTRYSTGREMDFENLTSTGKIPTDSLVKCGVIIDDNPAVIIEREYKQIKVKSAGEQRTVITITDL